MDFFMRKKNKTEIVKETILNYISNSLANKQYKLPAERILAEKLGYSRTTIVRAMAQLEEEGVIARKQGAGTFINKSEPGQDITIGLCMRTAYHNTDVHFRLIIESISRQAEKKGIFIQIYDRLDKSFSTQGNNRLLKAIQNGVIDGTIVISRMPLDIINQLNQAAPTVSINNTFGDGDEVPSVSCNYYRAGFIGAKYLLDKGHRKIVYLTNNWAHPEDKLIFSGFRSAFEMKGMSEKDIDILETRQNLTIASQRVREFFGKNRHTACFIRNSLWAIKIISLFNKLNIKVPDDISVMSVGNYVYSHRQPVELTLVDNHIDHMCREALDAIADMINEGKKPDSIMLLEPEIVEGNSVKSLI